MNRIRHASFAAIVSIALSAAAPPTAAQDGAAESPTIDGREIEYVYPDGGRVVMSFHDDVLGYRWLAGPFEGVEESGLEYMSRSIAPDVYMVSWHDADSANFATIVYDLAQNLVFSSAIVGYATDGEVVVFDRGVIERIETLD